MPTEKNIVYIDQAAAQNGSVSFTAYPSALTKGTYHVYLVGGGTAFAQSQVASFEYDKKYTLGDVNDDGAIDSEDALMALQIFTKIITPTETQRLAADVNRDTTIDSEDALLILRYFVKQITSFE